MAELSTNISNPESWARRHNAAVYSAIYNQPKNLQAAVISMVAAWEAYAKQHKARYESSIGDDGVLGDHWKAIGEGLLGLLNGETGELDCGTIDKFLRETMSENGIELEP